MPNPKPQSAAPVHDCCQPAADPPIQRWFRMGSVSRRLLRLIEASGDIGAARPSILELGCGPGSMMLALLERGAATAAGIDLSPESIAVAQRRATEAGVGDRTTFRVGDGAVTPLEPHDWVILDKVLCCYADLDALLGRSIAAARRRYVFVVPDSHGWRGVLAQALVRLQNLTNGLRGRPCPGYIHDLGLIEGRLEAAGFRRLGAPVGFRFWYLAVFERPAPA